jgi:hypothetical protein
MTDRYKEYVEQARNDGREVLRRYANGLDYIFVKERDGWYSILDVTGGIYRPVIQAKDIEHAESYIAMREPINVPVEFL